MEQVVTPPGPEPVSSQVPETQPPVTSPPAQEESDLTREDKLDAENIQPHPPEPTTTDKNKYQYKEEQWKPIDPEEKKRYDKQFLLGLRFGSASMNKPEGLPAISGIVLDEQEKSSAELTKQLERLIQDQADNQRICDWIEANLDEQQTSSNGFVRALMTSICQSAVFCEKCYKLDNKQIKLRIELLKKYLKDEQKELQALYALQAMMVKMEQPANLLQMFFDTLYDEDVIKEEAFYKWEISRDPAEREGKRVARKSVTSFFTWLREAEDKFDNN